MASQTNRRDRVMLRWVNISEEDLGRVDGIVWAHLESTNWIFSNQATWAGVVVVNTKPDFSINRDAFSRGKLFDNLRKFGLGGYARVPAPQVESALRQFVQHPDVKSVTLVEEAEHFLKAVKDSVVVEKQEKASIVSTKDTLDRLQREFYNLCKTDRMTVKQFYESK